MSDDLDLSGLRRSYEKDSLDESMSAASPLEQFKLWLSDALEKGVCEANAMTLATADEQGRPSTRPVLIKGFDEDGIVWFTNYQSRKGQNLDVNPYASVQFFWPELERVIRIEGKVEKLTTSLSDEYYASRPLTHRIGAWASPQSQVIKSRKVIVEDAAKYALKFGLTPPRPESWGGYRLMPQYWEFWQGRSSRLHDRIAYSLKTDGQWIKQRLAP
mgnify:CR=1 FL=1